VTACIKWQQPEEQPNTGGSTHALLTSQTALRVKLERVVLCHYAEARAEWRKYLFMDVHDDRDVMERCIANGSGASKTAADERGLAQIRRKT